MTKKQKAPARRTPAAEVGLKAFEVQYDLRLVIRAVDADAAVKAGRMKCMILPLGSVRPTGVLSPADGKAWSIGQDGKIDPKSERIV